MTSLQRSGKEEKEGLSYIESIIWKCKALETVEGGASSVEHHARVEVDQADRGLRVQAASLERSVRKKMEREGKERGTLGKRMLSA